MRVMDGVMAIPAILIAIALVALWRASLTTVIIAIAIPEIPRVTRLVRSLVLTIREEPYVEAAVSLGTRTLRIMFGHILPNTMAPLIVQGTYICASAILVEAILSFLGVGLPPDIPTWGNIMAEGRVQFNDFPHNVFFPGVFLALTVLAINMLGDGLRDTLDPRMSKRKRWRAPMTLSVEGSASSRPVLEVRDLTIALPPGGDRARAVERVSFSVAPHEIVCLVGESGSGKSVIAHAVMGLLPKTLKANRRTRSCCRARTSSARASNACASCAAPACR